MEGNLEQEIVKVACARANRKRQRIAEEQREKQAHANKKTKELIEMLKSTDDDVMVKAAEYSCVIGYFKPYFEVRLADSPGTENDDYCDSYRISTKL